MAILSAKRKLLLLKKEVTYNTDPTPDEGNNAILAFNMNVQILADEIRREFERSYFGAKPFVLANERAVIEFSFEYAGGGAADTPPVWAPIMEACGRAETINAATDVQYAPVSSSFDSATIYFWINTARFVLTGCRGQITELDKSIGSFPRFRVRLVGNLSGPTAVAFPADSGIDYSGFRTPLAVSVDSWAATLDSYAINLRTLRFIDNATVERYEGSEEAEVQNTDREVGFELTAFAPALGDKDYYAIAEATTEIALSSTVGTVAGDIIQVTAPKLQLNYPEPIEIQNGADGIRIRGQANPNTGNDELIIITK